jgi:GNAT superfamily N-acetyltransferase
VEAACTVRRARDEDAAAVSAVVRRAVRVGNARDYPPEVIERVARSFGPAEMQGFIAQQTVFVASVAGSVVGTASLNGNRVRTVFVAPDMQGRGIGRQLMQAVEQAALADAAAEVMLQATITAEGFYARLGYVAVREIDDGVERTIVMRRRLEA